MHTCFVINILFAYARSPSGAPANPIISHLKRTSFQLNPRTPESIIINNLPQPKTLLTFPTKSVAPLPTYLFHSPPEPPFQTQPPARQITFRYYFQFPFEPDLTYYVPFPNLPDALLCITGGEEIAGYDDGYEMMGVKDGSKQLKVPHKDSKEREKKTLLKGVFEKQRYGGMGCMYDYNWVMGSCSIANIKCKKQPPHVC